MTMLSTFKVKNPIAVNPCWERQDFAKRVLQISQELQERKYQNVTLHLSDVSEFACCLLACLHAKINVLLPPNLLEQNLVWAQNESDFILTDQEFRDLGLEQQVTLPQDLDELIDPYSQTQIKLKTSGSTGNPKVITKLACHMWQEATSLAKVFPFVHPELQVLGSVSCLHMYGLTHRVFLPLSQGWIIGRQQLVFNENLIAETTRPSVWISSPVFLSNLHQIKAQAQQNLLGVVCAGGVLSLETEQKLSQFKINVFEIYGSTETGVVAYRPGKGIWQTLSPVNIGVNEHECLWVESPWVNQREQTSDVVELSSQGFKLIGRNDRIVKINDKRVSLSQVEQELILHPWVQDAYVCKHPKFMRLVALVVLKPEAMLESQGRKPIIAELKHFLSKSQEKSVLPRYWRFIEQLPRNSQDKIDRQQVEQICLQPLN
ncbi:AMP-binding protein [Psittacicella hinzii]|uniref:Uncharacterized protein n=1 Tax=Psittacicella hinzii TaxID=2028575 RepID=A0A3A1YQ15_9GAMM|nr:class I adenylate-forming enzyme family protein [Psittacicella hinzii]RIY39715.1 hypothetical protein CKF58_01845 [Psittacicella hinzii]